MYGSSQQISYFIWFWISFHNIIFFMLERIYYSVEQEMLCAMAYVYIYIYNMYEWMFNTLMAHAPLFFLEGRCYFLGSWPHGATLLQWYQFFRGLNNDYHGATLLQWYQSFRGPNNDPGKHSFWGIKIVRVWRATFFCRRLFAWGITTFSIKMIPMTNIWLAT